MIIPNRYTPKGSTTGGGMGDIIPCTDNHLNRGVVLKMLKDGEEDRRLLDEQKALIKVRSKHVVQLYDVVEVQTGAGSKTALVLEHINGNDLTHDSYTADESYLKTIWQIACGLSEIHAEGIIHRDIKANNIRIDADSVIKILDFGLARTEGLDAKTVSIIGTPGYMAPELWTNPEVSFDQAIDVYAFGITALTLISTSLPQALLSRPPTPISKGALNGILTGISNEIIGIIEKCLSHTPSDRPTMKEVEELLRRHLLKDRHRALLALESKTYEINASSRKVTVSIKPLGSLGIEYDGINFKVTSISGAVSINNKTTSIGAILPASCVITFGISSGQRKFVTFDVSNPEVTA